MRYNLKNGTSKENIRKVISDESGFDQLNNKFFDSVCNQTMVGMVQPIASMSSSMSQYQVSCFYGEQVGHKAGSLSETPKSLTQQKSSVQVGAISTAKTHVEHLAETMLDLANKKGKGSRLMNLEPSEKSDFIIKTINKYSSQLGWKANECLLRNPDKAKCQNKNLA